MLTAMLKEGVMISIFSETRKYDNSRSNRRKMIAQDRLQFCDSEP